MLDHLPNELVTLVGSFAGMRAIGNLARTCRRMRALIDGESLFAPSELYLANDKSLKSLVACLRIGPRMTAARIFTIQADNPHIYGRLYELFTLMNACPNLQRLSMTDLQIRAPRCLLNLQRLPNLVALNVAHSREKALLRLLTHENFLPNLRKLDMRGCKWLTLDAICKGGSRRFPAVTRSLAHVDFRDTGLDSSALNQGLTVLTFVGPTTPMNTDFVFSCNSSLSPVEPFCAMLSHIKQRGAKFQVTMVIRDWAGVPGSDPACNLHTCGPSVDFWRNRWFDCFGDPTHKTCLHDKRQLKSH